MEPGLTDVDAERVDGLIHDLLSAWWRPDGRRERTIPLVVKPSGRRRLVGYLEEQYVVSERRACRLIRISRKAIVINPSDPIAMSNSLAG